MPGFGHAFGFGGGRKLASARRAAPPIAAALISPSLAWTGTPGTGFALPPTDPVRTTAKPACRLLVPPHQWFTDELLVGVYAGANNAGSLMETMGLQKVVAHYEGTSTDILSPSFQTFNDTNGNPVTYFGWWIKLKRDGRNGHAQLYFEAIPRNPTMQSRVIGPYQFSPQPVLHDHEITIAPSQPPVTGSRFQTFVAAMNFLRTAGAQNPKVTLVEPGDYPMNNGGVRYDFTNGWCEITATAPVRFTQTGTLGYYRPQIMGLRFRGANITLDFNIPTFMLGEVSTRQQWLDGIILTNSNGRYDLFQKNVRFTQGVIVAGFPWFTECEFSYLWHVAPSASLVRGCSFDHCFHDAFTHADCVVGNRLEDWDSTDYQTGIPALSVIYSGTEPSATLALSGNNNANNRILTATWGANSATFTIKTTAADFAADTNYRVASVVDWLNSLPGFSATLLNDSRRAAALASAGALSFSATNIRNVTLTLVTTFDVHADFWQLLDTGNSVIENKVIANNISIGMVSQNFFFGGQSQLRDMLAVNNAFYNKSGTGFANNTNYFSQYARTMSNVVLVHNTMATQGWMMRMDQAFNPDPYCLFANNSVRSITWIGAGTDADLVITDNHIHAGASLPSGATGTTTGGDESTLYANAESGDFSPAGSLLANSKTPLVKYDLTGAVRGALAALGAVQ